MAQKRLLVIDGNCLIYRACFAPGIPLTSARGEPTKGPYIFLQMLSRLCRENLPIDYLAVALDAPRKTLYRRQAFPAYKASRDRGKGPSEDMRTQFRFSLEILDALGIKTLSMDGYEADDVIATLAKRFRASVDVQVVSSDKDLHQVVRRNTVTCFDPGKWEELDQSAVEDRWLVHPKHVPTVQALAGDSSDGVPGVPGIGLVTAKKIAKQYQTIASIWDAKQLPSFTKKFGRASAALDAVSFTYLQGQLDLVRLDSDVPLKKVSLRELAFDGLDLERGRPLFNYLGFRKWKTPPGGSTGSSRLELARSPRATSSRPPA